MDMNIDIERAICIRLYHSRTRETIMIRHLGSQLLSSHHCILTRFRSGVRKEYTVLALRKRLYDSVRNDECVCRLARLQLQ
jgi:hypothetical protein